MKLTLLLVIAVILTARGDTNIIAVLTTADGSFYTNARIDHTTPVEAIVWFEGGIARVALTNLPAALQNKYPCDTNAATQFLAMEKQKSLERKALAFTNNIAKKAWLAEQARTAGWIYVSSLTSGPGPHIYTGGNKGLPIKIYLKNAPTRLDNITHHEIMQAFQYRDAVQDMNAANYYHDSDARAEARKEMNQVQEDSLRTEQDTKVRAFDTGEIYGGLHVWQYVEPVTVKTASPAALPRTSH